MTALRERLQTVEDSLGELRDERIGAVYDYQQACDDVERARAALEANKLVLSEMITNAAALKGCHFRFDELLSGLQHLEITWEE